MSIPSLCSLIEIPDLQCDACLVDNRFDLQFISLWGRETAVKELLAKITIGKPPLGLNELRMDLPSSDITVFIPDGDALQKQMTHIYKHTLFGNLLHVWLYHQVCVMPDKANHRTTLIYPKHLTHKRNDALWRQIKDVCPLPLLNIWQDKVITLLDKHQMITPLKCVIGSETGWQVTLDIDVLEREIGTMIAFGQLTTELEA